MKRRQKRVPDTAQGRLRFDESEKKDERVQGKVRVGATWFVPADCGAQFVGEERLEEYLKQRGQGWIVRLHEELKQVDFSLLERNYEGGGRAAYHPRTMMGLIVYGVLEGKHSLRELEKLAVSDVGAWLICGGKQPDHSTIGDFVERHREQVTTEYFTQLVKGITERKGVRAGVVAVDGTVVEASVSRFGALSREAAEKAAEKAKEKAEGAAQTPEAEELAELAKQAEGVAEIARRRAEQRKEKGGKDADKTPAVSPGDPDAVIQKCKDGRCRPAYKPSVLVHESGLIIAMAVTPSSETAAVAELLSQHDAVFGEKPTAALFDGGYHSKGVLEVAAEQEINMLCPSGKTTEEQWKKKGSKGKYGRGEFAYDQATDTYRCPAGQSLTPGAEFEHKRTGQRARKYRTKECCGCPLRTNCTESRDGRTIVRMEGDDLKDVMEYIMAQPGARREYRKRREIVERIFAEFSWRQGLRRFRRRGTRRVFAEFALHAIAHNLKWASARAAQRVWTRLWSYLRLRERISGLQHASASNRRNFGNLLHAPWQLAA